MMVTSSSSWRNNLNFLITLLSSSSMACLLLVLLLPTLVTGQEGGNTCEWDGKLFVRGQSLGNSFITRCGTSSDYPCYCNPDLSPPIQCPYCGFATLGGSLICAEDNQVVTFNDLDGLRQTCDCQVPIPYSTPISTCQESVVQDDDNDNSIITDEDDNDVCTIDLPNGTTKIFARGESLGDELLTRCGAGFFCTCNPDLESQLECPFCGFATFDGDLLCARDDETVAFQDPSGSDMICSCQIVSINQAQTDCIENDGSFPPPLPPSPTLAPVPATPTGSVFPPWFTPLPPPVATTIPPTQSPQQSVLPRTASPTNPPTTTQDVEEYCTLVLEDGTTMEFANGESYGQHLSTRCGPPSEYPCFCNTAAPNQKYCPYCGFVSSTGSILCSKDDDILQYEDAGVLQTCTCNIPLDPLAPPIRNCSAGPLPTQAPAPTPSTLPGPLPTQAPAPTPPTLPVPTTPVPSTGRPSSSAPTTNPIAMPSSPTVTPGPIDIEIGCTVDQPGGTELFIPNGNSFGDLVIGPCGATADWPSFCSTNSIGVIGKRLGIDDDGSSRRTPYKIIYPYCIFETVLGTPICARDSETIDFVDLRGVDQSCSCTYSNTGSGAQSICVPSQPQQEPSPSPPVHRPTPNQATHPPIFEMPTTIASPPSLRTPAPVGNDEATSSANKLLIGPYFVLFVAVFTAALF